MVVVGLTTIILSACGRDDSTSGDGDCTARIRYEGVIYRYHDLLNQTAPSGRDLGGGEVVDCGTAEKAPVVAEVSVSSVRGVAPSVAVKVVRGYGSGVYVAEDLPRGDWPEDLLVSPTP